MHLWGLLFSSASFGAWSLVLWCCVSGPGISSYASDPAQAGESLQGCLEAALALIPKAKHQQTPMFLGATGGMRLLRCGAGGGPHTSPGRSVRAVVPAQRDGGGVASASPSGLSSPRSQKNSSQAEDVFAAVSQALSRSPVAFWGAELLAGQDEGALGWVTINYVLGLLVQVPQTAPGWEGHPGGSSWPAPGWEGHSGGHRSPRTQCRLSVVSTPSPENGSSLWRGRWWAPWTWVGPPPRSPLCLEAPSWTPPPRPPSASMAQNTASTPTATSASGATRC